MAQSTTGRSRKVGQGFDRKYACSYQGCTRAYTREEHLRRHKLNHDASQKLTCTRCTAKFSREDLWRRHLRVSHHIEHAKQPHSRRPNGVRSANRNAISSGRDSQSPSPQLAELNQVQSGNRLIQDSRPSDLDVPLSLLSSSLNDKITAPSDSVILDAAADSEPSSEPLPCDDSYDLQFETIDDEDNPLQSNTSFPLLAGSAELSNPILTTDGSLYLEDGLDSRHVAFMTDDDISWLFDDSSVAQFDSTLSLLFRTDPSKSLSLDHAETSDLPTTSFQPSQQSETEAVVDSTGPTCGFRICNALTDSHRDELLDAIRDLPDVDFEDPMFSLNRLKEGVHLYARYMSKEYAFFHHRIFAPNTEEERAEIREYYGEEPPVQLTWAMITLGWSLSETRTEHETQIAAAIQGVLRKFVLTHSAFTLTPPLWILQLLFLVLVFARYQGPRAEYSYAVFYSVLICAVRRLDLSITQQCAAQPVNVEVTTAEWLQWIRAETIRRIVFHTFILDVQQIVLHGGDASMSVFELNLEMPCSGDAWFAESIEGWKLAIAQVPHGPQRFLPVLKLFWNRSARNQLPFSYPRDSRVVMYGIISIASEMRRRQDHSFSLTSKDSLSHLSSRVQKSSERWLGWWGSDSDDLNLEVWQSWRNCSCMFKIAYTLYEVNSVDLQMIAGREIIEGKRMRPPDYVKSQRKLRRWVKQDYAPAGVSLAAKIIQDRISSSFSPHLHCHHCHWILYLAGLVCWAYGFAVTANMQNDGLLLKGRVVSETLARQQCDEYLAAATEWPDTATSTNTNSNENIWNGVNKTTGLLITLIGVLEHDGGSVGLIAEAVDVLKRLVGMETSVQA